MWHLLNDLYIITLVCTCIVILFTFAKCLNFVWRYLLCTHSALLYTYSLFVLPTIVIIMIVMTTVLPTIVITVIVMTTVHIGEF